MMAGGQARLAREAVEKAMLTVTEAAKVFLADLIEARGYSAEIAIRLLYGDRGLTIVGDSERAGDVTFQHEDRTVLLLGEHLWDLPTDRRLVVDGLEMKLHENHERA
jgi:hypothetical protein